ncbi:cytochrome P450 4e3-like isoform X2 [Schistocerca americana]|uniref:cytochrome P450 4e3-like isoform X2 n=1 Tax=Schistocerca americana TaxID=7009 RepID=UPI001F4FE737|nr:cytochrome P450 4e3-like isoform X2 [Schistocerca americana]
MSGWTACLQGLGLVVGALLAVFSWLWITRPRTNAPGPTPVPLLGNLPHFWRKLPIVVNEFRKMQRQYGDVFRFYIGPKLILIATQPDDAKRLLVGCKMRERDDYTTRALIPFSGYGLIVNKGELWKTHRKLIEPTFHAEKRFYQPWLQIDWIISLTPDGEALKRQLNLYNGMAKQGLAIIRERRSKALPKKRKTFLDVMMDDHGNLLLPESEVYDEVRTFGLAGTDTTATALSCIFALLGLYPEWQDAIQKEVDEIFGTGEDYLRPVTESDLTQLKVTEAVIKESLRLFPAVPVAPVFASEDIPLSDGRYVAPRGSVVFVFLNLLHRQPAIYPDPDKFDPGRFLEGGGTNALPPYSYLPFGAGSRLCVGARFAMLVMKTVLATVMRQFRIIPGSTREELEEIGVFITGKPVHGINIRCVPRTAPVTVDCT